MNCRGDKWRSTTTPAFKSLDVLRRPAGCECPGAFLVDAETIGVVRTARTEGVFTRGQIVNRSQTVGGPAGLGDIEEERQRRSSVARVGPRQPTVFLRF